MYFLLKTCVRIGLLFYLKNITIALNIPYRPVILACNHPNAFLDAMILASYSKRPVHFLVRGDVFSKPVINKLLRSLNMIPVFRDTEGSEQLKHNEASFKECMEVLKNNGTLLVFSEGVCKNEWILRPLKKGTARLALMGWQNEKISGLSVIPVALSYSSFTNIPMSVYVKKGKPIVQDTFIIKTPSHFYNDFNRLLKQQLEMCLRSKESFVQENKKPVNLKTISLSIPAFIGWITHKPFYNLIRGFAQRKTAGTFFFHAVLFGILLFAYPVFLILVATIFVLLTHNVFFWILILLLPLTAYCYKEYKC